MATEFAMPAPSMASAQYTTSPTQYNLYGTQSQPLSPANSANATPHNSSPTSPHTPAVLPLPVHPRQLRPPKSPLYVPAVLRPTDPPKRVIKQSPTTPPQSMNNSFDNLNNARPLSRTSTMDSGKFGLGKIAESSLNISGLSKVTDLPTREHWKPDAEASICDETTCTKPFSYFNRRHHCRRCGNIFCDAHSPYAVPLDQDASFHLLGTRSRACEYCFSEYKGWEIARLSRKSSESSEEQPNTPTTPIVNCGAKTKSAISSVFGTRKDGTPESMGQSVPRDWNWSTF